MSSAAPHVGVGRSTAGAKKEEKIALKKRRR
jgi:hypothetical protein